MWAAMSIATIFSMTTAFYVLAYCSDAECLSVYGSGVLQVCKLSYGSSKLKNLLFAFIELFQCLFFGLQQDRVDGIPVCAYQRIAHSLPGWSAYLV